MATFLRFASFIFGLIGRLSSGPTSKDAQARVQSLSFLDQRMSLAGEVRSLRHQGLTNRTRGWVFSLRGESNILGVGSHNVSISRGRYDAQLFTNDREKLSTALGNDVSHQSAHGPQKTCEQSISPRQDHGARYEPGIGLGISMSERREGLELVS